MTGVLACDMGTRKSSPSLKKAVQAYEVLLFTTQDSAIILGLLWAFFIWTRTSIVELEIVPTKLLSSLLYSREKFWFNNVSFSHF